MKNNIPTVYLKIIDMLIQEIALYEDKIRNMSETYVNKELARAIYLNDIKRIEDKINFYLGMVPNERKTNK
jgi:hypothetical protein